MTDREQDVAIAKAMGIGVVNWPYFCCGGVADAYDEDESGKPSYGHEERGCTKLFEGTAVWMPSYRYLGGHNIPDDRDWYGHRPIPHYETPEGSWKILDYIRENPSSSFAIQFMLELGSLLHTPKRLEMVSESRYSVFDHVCCLVEKLTPSLIRDAAYEAAKELIA